MDLVVATVLRVAGYKIKFQILYDSSTEERILD